ncbi:MAG: PH domain-containing protein [bacterium]|nr:PH domain-containing protein [bacterium]
MSNHYQGPVSVKRKKQFAHYLNDDEEMVTFTTVSSHYLVHKFVFHFLAASLITFPVFFLVQRVLSFDLNFGLGGALVLALVYACQRYYFTKEGIQYILTNKRLIVQTGYFQVTLCSASYNKVTHIEVRQGVMDRLFYKYGKIIVGTAGSDQKSIVLDYIGQPVAFKNIMEGLIASERQEYGHSSV